MADENIQFKLGLDDSSIDGAIGKIQNKFLKLGAALAGAFAVGKIIESSIEGEAAVNKLNSALASAGRFSKSASDSFQEMAQRLQNTTTLSDEAVLSAAALASNFTKTNDQAKKLTEAAIQLSSATGKDLNTSITSLGKSLNGSSFALKQIGVDTGQFTKKQLEAGAAIDLVNQRFAGSAQNQLLTFGGALKRLTNLFDDILEKIGDMITQSPVVRAAIVVIGDAFNFIIKQLDGLASKDPLGNFIISAIKFSQGMSQYVLAPFELASNAISSLMNTVFLAKKFVDDILSSGISVALDRLKNTPSPFENIFDFSITSKAEEALTNFGNKVVEISQNTKTAADGLKNNIVSTIQETSSLANKLGEITKSGTVKLMSAAAQGVGAILAGNVGAFEALGNTMRGILGDMLIQAGEAIVAEALAFESFKASIMSFFGGGGVAAGLLLIAAGSAIKGAAQSMTSPTLGVGGPQVTPTESFTTDDFTDKTTAVTINVEGTVLSPRDVGIQIAEILSDTFSANDTKVIARA